jgi:hypothetical protein
MVRDLGRVESSWCGVRGLQSIVRSPWSAKFRGQTFILRVRCPWSVVRSPWCGVGSP